jgi:L-asparaginase
MTRRGDPGVLIPSTLAPDLVRYVPALARVAQIEGVVVCNVDSSDMNPEHWAIIASTIVERQDDFDGFVVLHGTDTMAFTATALSFMLTGHHKPVVFTGSQRPLAQARTDARANLVHSAIAATMDIPEVSLFFGNHLLRGNRSTKTSIHAYEAFASPNHPPLLEVGVDVKAIATPLRREEPLSLKSACATDVAVLSLVPGMSPSILDHLIDQGNRVVLLRSFGEGNIPQHNWPEAIEHATSKGVHIIVNSQCRTGSSAAGRYIGSLLAAQAGALFSGDMTGEAAVVKAMCLLGQGVTGQAFRNRFRSPLAGELTPGSAGPLEPSSHGVDSR